MTATRKVAAALGSALAPRVLDLAPGVTSTVVLQALDRAINGIGPLPGAAAAAEKQLEEQDGHRGRAVREVIENHVTYAGANGFLTSLGGLITAAVTIPANVAGLALVQCRMVSGIAHLHGYDLEDPRTRYAVLECLLGEDKVDKHVKAKKLPAPPMAVATAPVVDTHLSRTVTDQVAAELLGRVTGRRLAVTVGRKIPIVGGVVGASADGYATWRIGRYASRELLPRAR